MLRSPATLIYSSPVAKRHIVFLVGSLILCGLVIWPAVYAAIEARRCADYYRGQFAATQRMTIAMENDEWAFKFGGRAGLSQLRVLSTDQTLKPAGRRRALELYDYIEHGKHVPDLRQFLAGTTMAELMKDPFTYGYASYLYAHDWLSSK